MLIVGLFVLFGLSAGAPKDSDTIQISPNALVVNLVIFALLVSIITFYVSRRIRPTDWLGLRWRKWPHVFWIGPTAVIGMWIVLGFLQASGYISWMEKLIGGSSTQDAVKLMRESKDNVTVAMMCFSAAIVAPLAEEIIFRGYLFPVAKKFGGLWIGMIFSSLVFAAGHGNVPLLLPLFLLGMVMAYAYEKTGSIWSSIAIHFCFNSATVVLQLAHRLQWLTLPDQS